MKSLRRYFIAGLLVWLPLAVTVLLVRFVINVLNRLLPASYRLESWIGFEVPGLGLITAFVVVLVTGMLAANIVGRRMVDYWEALMRRIPIIRSIYAGAKNFAEIVFSDSGQSFKKVLLIEYPRKGLYSLAFQTATSLGEVQGRTGEDVVCTFVPTTPNPTSGFIIMVPKKDVIELDMAVDEALKMIISLGVVVPTWSRQQTSELPLRMPPDMPPRSGE
ncbi:MAG: DUF502 domain-containing protein [Woeseia sp.]